MSDKSNQLDKHLALSVDRLSALLGLSRWTIYNLVCQRKIPYVKVGRRVLFPVKAIEKWLDENTVEAING